MHSETPSMFDVIYVGFEPFPEAITAFQTALDIWSGVISTPVPIKIRAEFVPLEENILGSASAEHLWRDFPLVPFGGTWYPDGLADQLRGADSDPLTFDIGASFNSAFPDWYFGTDGAPPLGRYDFVSVALHEIAHGLGMLGAAAVDDGQGSVGLSGVPVVFDRFTATEAGVPLLSFVSPSAELATPLTSAFNPTNPFGPGTYWMGAHGISANGGVPPRLYTPSSWQPGSSYSHLDEDTFPAGHPNSLMTPSLMAAEAIHHPGPVTLALLADIGWNNRSAANTRDFNGDGHPDLIYQSTTGHLYTWFMNGITFTGGAYFTPDHLDPNLQVVGTGDFTGDDVPDLLVQHQVHGAVTLFKLDDLTMVGQQPIPIAAYTPWRVAAVADFNSDGHLDILWRHETLGQLYIWFMKPNEGWAGYGGPGGSFAGDYVRDATQQIVTIDSPNMYVGGAADINRDGRTDLVWQDVSSGALRVWYMNQSTRVANLPFSPATVNPAWRIRTVGDYDNDGNADLIWQNTTTGDLHIWRLNGASLSSSGPLSPERVNLIWRIVGPR